MTGNSKIRGDISEFEFYVSALTFLVYFVPLVFFVAKNLLIGHNHDIHSDPLQR